MFHYVFRKMYEKHFKILRLMSWGNIVWNLKFLVRTKNLTTRLRVPHFAVWSFLGPDIIFIYEVLHLEIVLKHAFVPHSLSWPLWVEWGFVVPNLAIDPTKMHLRNYSLCRYLFDSGSKLTLVYRRGWLTSP